MASSARAHEPGPAPAAADAPASQRQAELPPGPRLPALVQTFVWALAPTWAMDRWSARLGDTFTITFWPSGMHLVLVSDPDDVKTVFTAPPEVAPSAAASSPVAPVMGPSSVVVLTGPEHMRQRKLLLPPFHGERMREYAEVIVQATRSDMARWPLGRPMRLQAHTRAITLEVILRAVFGVEAERMAPLRAAIGQLLDPTHTLAMVRFALSSRTFDSAPREIRQALAHLDGLIFAEIARRRAQRDLEERTDILSLLLLARDEQDGEMTDGELRDELVTLLLAGHETTATAVAWAVERLVRHPDKLARLQAEIDAGDGEEYLTAVVTETLRVRPVVPLVARMLTQPLRVGSHVLPAGTRVAPSIYLTNRSPRTYQRPRDFRPERFLGQAPDTFAWIPFGGGIRRCIGASFALQEMKLILRTMLAELEPQLPPSRARRSGEWVRRRAVTLVPSAGARVVWRTRSARFEDEKAA